MIIYWYGDRGSGKTLSSVMIANLFKEYYKKNNEKPLLFANVKMENRDYDMLKFYNKEFQNHNQPKIFLFDEIDKFADNRTSSSMINRVIGYTISLSRKTNTDFLITSQYYKAVDFRIRGFCDFIIAPEIKEKKFLYWEIFNNKNATTSKRKINVDLKTIFPLYNTNYLTIDLISEYLIQFKIISKAFKKSN